MISVRGAVLLLVGVSAGCWEDRVRPSPLEPTDTLGISVDVLRPVNNQVVIAGRSVPVEVVAIDALGETLTGIGFVARQLQGAVLLDSVATFFPPGPSARDTFELQVPAALPASTQLSIQGLAFRGTGVARRTPARLVVVAQCPPNLPNCQPD